MNMIRIASLQCLVGVACTLFATTALAQADNEPAYKPPVRGAPSSRVGGGSRSVGLELPRMYVLAPVDIGFTTKGKPELFWFASDASPAKVVLTVYTDDPSKPLLEQPLAAVIAPGIQRVRLADYPLELQPRTEYRWRVTMIDEAKPARAVASGAIQRTNAWPKLQARVQNQGTDTLAVAGVYAEEGLWYDALEAIAQSGDTPKARKYRAALLDQVGLTDVSQFESARK